MEVLGDTANVRGIWLCKDYGQTPPSIPERPVGNNILLCYKITGDGQEEDAEFHVNNNVFEDYDAACKLDMAKYGKDAGRFIYPFFARIGLRMYDGTILRTSAPCLLTPCEGQVPITITEKGVEQYQSWYLLNSCQLQWKITEQYDVDKYKNIVREVVLYITPPCYTYDEGLKHDDNRYFATYRMLADIPAAEYPYRCLSTLGEDEPTSGNYDIIDAWRTSEGRTRDCYVIEQNREKSVGVGDMLAGSMQFYEVLSVPIDKIKDEAGAEITDTFSPVKIESWKLGDTLVTLPTLTNDSIVADTRTLVAQYSFMYNSRAHMYGGEERRFLSANIVAENGTQENDGEAIIHDFIYDYSFRVHSSTESGECLYGTGAYKEDDFSQFGWICVPDVNATTLDIAIRRRRSIPGMQTTYKALTIPLKRHDFLNCAYAYVSLAEPRTGGAWGNTESAFAVSIRTTPTYAEVQATNKLYVSEVNNPWYFPAANVHVVGNGRIWASIRLQRHSVRVSSVSSRYMCSRTMTASTPSLQPLRAFTSQASP